MFTRTKSKHKAKFKPMPQHNTALCMQSLLEHTDDTNNGIDTLRIDYHHYFYRDIKVYADEHGGIESLPSEVLEDD